MKELAQRVASQLEEPVCFTPAEGVVPPPTPCGESSGLVSPRPELVTCRGCWDGIYAPERHLPQLAPAPAMVACR